MVVATRQLTEFLEYAPMMEDTQAPPAQVATYVKSATPSWAHEVSASSQCTGSGRHVALEAGLVVFNRLDRWTLQNANGPRQPGCLIPPAADFNPAGCLPEFPNPLHLQVRLPE